MRWVRLQSGYLHIQMLQKLSSYKKTRVDIINVGTGEKLQKTMLQDFLYNLNLTASIHLTYIDKYCT